MYKVKFYNPDGSLNHEIECVGLKEAKIRAKEWCLSNRKRSVTQEWCISNRNRPVTLLNCDYSRGDK